MRVDWLAKLVMAERQVVDLAVATLPEIARASTRVIDTQRALDGLATTTLRLRDIVDRKYEGHPPPTSVRRGSVVQSVNRSADQRRVVAAVVRCL